MLFINFVHLKYFLAVCELGTVSAAAEYLHIAQPSLSLAIKELESEFGTQLFNREHRGMRLTKSGQQLLEMSRDIIERMDNAERKMKNIGRDNKTLTLGIPPMIGSLILPIIYNEFISKNSDIHLNLVECGREEMLKKVTDGQLDMALVSHDRNIAPGGVASLRLGTLEMVCASKSQTKITRNEAVTAAELSDTPLVMFKGGFFQTDILKAWFSKSGVEPVVLIKTDQLSTITKLIKSGTAAGFIFKRLIENESSLAWRPLSPPLSVGVSLIWQKNDFFSSSMKRFKTFLEKIEIFK